MHFLAVVLLPQHTSDVESTVTSVVEPYYVEAEGPTRKEYLDARAIQHFTSQWLFPPRDLGTIAARLTKRFSTTFQVDEGGIYYIADDNPNGKCDYWTLHSLADDVWPVSAMPQDLLPAAVVTPDGAWHDIEIGIGKWDWDLTSADKYRIRHEAYTLISQYADHLAVRLDCHI